MVTPLQGLGDTVGTVLPGLQPGLSHGRPSALPIRGRAAALKFLSTPQTGNLPTGFFQNETYGNRGTNYGWGIGTCVLRTPHEGVAEMLSPGSYGHGGAWGTQAWIDPVKGVAYVLMVQRSNFPNSDATSAANSRKPPRVR